MNQAVVSFSSASTVCNYDITRRMSVEGKKLHVYTRPLTIYCTSTTTVITI